MSNDRYQSYLDDFGAQLAAAAAARQPQRRHWFSRPRLLIVLPLTLATGAAALAASGLLSGHPVQTGAVVPAKPHAGSGIAIGSPAPVAGLAVADPLGGPGWGLRIVPTTRHTGCIQVGRLLHGQLGELGTGGAFANDGLFHPLPASVLDDAACQPLDGARRLFDAMSVNGFPASASRSGCVVAGPEQAPVIMAAGDGPSACSTAQMRALRYGALGPNATRVHYTGPDGRPASAPVVGPDGAYLIVMPVASQHPEGGVMPELSPSHGLLSVDYRNGHACHIRQERFSANYRRCPLVGYTPIPQPKLTAAQLRAPVHATITTDAAGRKLTVSFIAPVAAHGVTDYYQVSALFAHGCDTGAVHQPIAYDVAAGETVTTTMQLPYGCPNPTGMVRYHQASPRSVSDQMPYGGDPVGDPVVGRFAVSP